ncbi:hypothetical protein HY346_02325 [Candidatus Microgenomates bacterium]|nr:hypothetical protein [Candidatus Microgenomates bacterium]
MVAIVVGGVVLCLIVVTGVFLRAVKRLNRGLEAMRRLDPMVAASDLGGLKDVLNQGK